LTNIKRHSKAGTAVVNLEFAPEYLTITINDDGQGFFPPKRFHGLATAGKLGLAGIQERINFLNGTFRIDSRPGSGTTLFLEVKC
jgi:signal transduction histidine kinase